MPSILDTANKRYQVTFYEREEPLNRLTAWLGDTPPTPSAGGGGYNVITLPFRSAVSVWQGRAGLLVQDIPIMLWQDAPEIVTPILPPKGNFGLVGAGGTTVYNFSDPPSRPTSTTAQANRLIKMWRPDDDTEAPPIIRVNAPNNLVPYQQLPFWISDFTWGAAIGDDTGTRVMQQLVIQVTEYRADEELQTTKAKTPAKSKRQKTYVARSGDTLSSIAKHYHLRNGWRQLAAAQNPVITDPRQLRVGQRLIIPANT